VLGVLYYQAEFGGTRFSSAAGATKNVEFVCLSVCHAFERQFVRTISSWGVGIQK